MRRFSELRNRVLSAIGAGFALAAVTNACAGESTESERGGTMANGKGGGAGAAGTAMIDSGGADGFGGTGGGASGTTATGGIINVDGRPFVVADAARLPDVALGRPTAGDELAELEDLPDAERRELGAFWLESARREHASVAAFALLELELLAVGAPARLVEQASRAALDEIEHARMAFALSSRFLGREVAPGALDMAGVAPKSDLADIASRAAREGCVLETISAALALARHAEATDPEVARALERIARDETRHAELSYELVAWAIATGGARVRRAVARALDAAAEPAVPSDSATPAFARFGMLGQRAAFEVMLEARRRVIEPAATAMLSAAPS